MSFPGLDDRPIEWGFEIFKTFLADPAAFVLGAIPFRFITVLGTDALPTERAMFMIPIGFDLEFFIDEFLVFQKGLLVEKSPIFHSFSR
jgi:hypothetical protein